VDIVGLLKFRMRSRLKSWILPMSEVDPSDEFERLFWFAMDECFFVLIVARSRLGVKFQR
jgi:hypothetical protein